MFWLSHRDSSFKYQNWILKVSVEVKVLNVKKQHLPLNIPYAKVYKQTVGRFCFTLGVSLFFSKHWDVNVICLVM